MAGKLGFAEKSLAGGFEMIFDNLVVVIGIFE